MNKSTMSFLVQVTVDDDNEGTPEPDEVKQQIEHSLLDGDAETEFGIVDVQVRYMGVVDVSDVNVTVKEVKG